MRNSRTLKTGFHKFKESKPYNLENLKKSLGPKKPQGRAGDQVVKEEGEKGKIRAWNRGGSCREPRTKEKKRSPRRG